MPPAPAPLRASVPKPAKAKPQPRKAAPVVQRRVVDDDPPAPGGAWCVGRNTCRRGPRHNHNHMTPNGTRSSRNTHRGKPAPGISSGNPTAASTDANE